MSGAIVGRRVVRLGTVGSTMDEVAALAEAGEPEGLVVTAEAQRSGRGRGGRPWTAPPGRAILASVLLRPPVPAAALATLPLVAGVAVAEAIERLAPLAPRLKWPNDVWLGERKVAGILVAARHAGAVPRVVLGVGLNANADRGHLPAGATSLAVELGRPVDREEVLSALLDRLDAAYRAYLAAGGRPDLDGWRRRAALLGEAVTVQAPDGLRAGVLRGIDDDGALLLEARDGWMERVTVGEVVRGPVPVDEHGERPRHQGIDAPG